MGDTIQETIQEVHISGKLKQFAGLEILVSGMQLETELDTYTLVECIGEGGMAQVWKAQTEWNEFVAIKFIRNFCGDLSAYKDRLRKEAELTQEMNHPNVVDVIEFVDREDACFLVMEYVENGDLLGYIERESSDSGGISPAKACHIAKNIADIYAIAHMAGKRIVHRDLKPQNVLIDADGNAKLSDFGIAKDLDETSGLTQGPGALGTTNYMAPERFDNPWLVSVQSDMYGLGLILFQTLTGRLPFEATDMKDAQRKHSREIPPLVNELNPQVSRPISDITACLLAKNPEARFTPAGLVAALTRLEEGLKPEFPASYRSWMKRRSYRYVLAFQRNRRTVFAIAAVLVACAALSVSWVVVSRGDDSYTIAERELRTKRKRKQFEAALQRAESQLPVLKKAWDAKAWNEAKAALDEADPAAQNTAERETLAARRKQLNGIEEARKEKYIKEIFVIRGKMGDHREYDAAMKALDDVGSLLHFSFEQSELLRLKDVLVRQEEKRCKSLEEYLVTIRSGLAILGSDWNQKVATNVNRALLAADALARLTGEIEGLKLLRKQVSVCEEKRSNEFSRLTGAVTKQLKSNRPDDLYVTALTKLDRIAATEQETREVRALRRSIDQLMGSEATRKLNLAGILDRFKAIGQVPENHAELSSLKLEATSLVRTTDEEQRVAAAIKRAEAQVAEYLVSKGKSAFELQQFESAQRFLLQAQELNDDDHLLKLIADVNREVERDELLTARRRKYDQLVNEGRILSRQQKWVEAENTFCEALAIPGYESDEAALDRLYDLLLGQAKIHDKSGNWDEVLKLSDKILELKPGNFQASDLKQRALDRIAPPCIELDASSNGQAVQAIVWLDGVALAERTPLKIPDVKVGQVCRLRIDAEPVNGIEFISRELEFNVRHSGSNRLGVELTQHRDFVLDEPESRMLAISLGSPTDLPINGRQVVVTAPFWISGDTIPWPKEQAATWEDADEYCRRMTQTYRELNELPAGYVYRLPTCAELALAQERKRFVSSARTGEFCWDAYSPMPPLGICNDPSGPEWSSKRSVRTGQGSVFGVGPDDEAGGYGFRIVLALNRETHAELSPEVAEQVRAAIEVYDKGNYESAIEHFSTLLQDIADHDDGQSSLSEEHSMILRGYLQAAMGYRKLAQIKAQVDALKKSGRQLTRRSLKDLESNIARITTEYKIPKDSKYTGEVEQGILHVAGRAKADESPSFF